MKELKGKMMGHKGRRQGQNMIRSRKGKKLEGNLKELMAKCMWGGRELKIDSLFCCFFMIYQPFVFLWLIKPLYIV